MTTSSSAATPRRAVIASAIGNVLEWYDFALYAFLAATIGRQFFPAANEIDSLIAAFGVFAAGYFMRPLGGIIFGYIGDRYGRKKVLVFSILAMVVPTVGIALLPTTTQIGTVAAVLLVILRLCQGISIGGEYTGSVVYLAERAKQGRRGLFCTTSILGAGVGTLLGSGAADLVNQILPREAVESWGWRLPFLAGALLGFVGWYLRRDLPETSEGTQLAEESTRAPLIETITTEWRPVLRVTGLNLMHAVSFFMIFIFMKTYLHLDVGLPRLETRYLPTLGLIVLMLMTGMAGALSDRFGRKPLLISSALAMIILAYPLLVLINMKDFWIVVACQIAFAVIVGAYAGTVPATMAEILPSKIRVTGASLGYNLCMSLFGGTTPLITFYLVRVSGNNLVPAYYLILAAAVSLAVALTIKETGKSALRQ